MPYRVPNFLTGFDIVESEEDAVIKLQQNGEAFLEYNSYMFTIQKEVIDGNSTQRCDVNLNSDPEEGIYFVFNDVTGTHEVWNSLSQAKDRKNQLKQDFLRKNWGDKTIMYFEDSSQSDTTGLQSF